MASYSPRIADSGSNYKYYDKKLYDRIPRSSFDLSYLNTLDASVGPLYPVWVQHTVPNEDYTINIEALVRCINPPVVPILSRLRVFFHTYWCSYDQLSRGWQVLMSKGRDGKYTGSVPSFALGQADYDLNLFQRGSLLDYLGYNLASYPAKSGLPASRFDTGFTALSAMAYQLIFRDYYMNQNLYSSGDDREDWFPFDDDLFRLPLSEDLASATGCPDGCVLLGKQSSDFRSYYTPERVGLGILRYRSWTEDYFTSSRPWLQRGSEANLAFDFTSDDNLPVGIMDDGVFNAVSNFYHINQRSSVLGSSSPSTDPFAGDIEATSFAGSWNSGSPFTMRGFSASSGSHQTSGGVVSLGSRLDSALRSPSGGYPLVADVSGLSGSSNITLALLRDLNAAQRMMEKMARTDGSYGEFCQTFFNQVPASSRHHRPYYVGGCYQQIIVSEVLQTSGIQYTPTGQVASVQGNQSGHMISHSNGYVGNFHCDDFGVFITLMSIVPDSMYFQGIHRDNTKRVQEEFYLPERAGLSPQAVLNKEIYYQVDSTGNVSENDDILSYQDIWDEMRFRSNEVHGKVADSTNESFFPYTMARDFSALPTWSKELLEMSSDNVRTDWLTAPSEVPFVVQVANKVRAVRPLPYRAEPAELFQTSR